MCLKYFTNECKSRIIYCVGIKCDWGGKKHEHRENRCIRLNCHSLAVRDDTHHSSNFASDYKVASTLPSLVLGNISIVHTFPSKRNSFRTEGEKSVHSSKRSGSTPAEVGAGVATFSKTVAGQLPERLPTLIEYFFIQESV